MTIQPGGRRSRVSSSLSRVCATQYAVWYDCDAAYTWSHLFPTAHVYAVECNPETLAKCRANIPALFWLDAHHSGGVTANAGYDPIFEELKSIYMHPIKRHVIPVDGARGHAVEGIIREAPPSHKATVRNDIIRIVPRI